MVDIPNCRQPESPAMFGPTGAAAAAQPSIEACRSRMTSAACHGMTVDYLTASDEPECSPFAGRIHVLIPSDDAMFEASLRRSGAACRTTLMRGPRIAIVPADVPHAAYRPRPFHRRVPPPCCVTPRAYRLQNSHSMDARRPWSGELSGVPKGQPAL
jgi:hypothetical protein